MWQQAHMYTQGDDDAAFVCDSKFGDITVIRGEGMSQDSQDVLQPIQLTQDYYDSPSLAAKNDMSDPKVEEGLNEELDEDRLIKLGLTSQNQDTYESQCLGDFVPPILNPKELVDPKSPGDSTASGKSSPDGKIDVPGITKAFKRDSDLSKDLEVQFPSQAAKTESTPTAQIEKVREIKPQRKEDIMTPVDQKDTDRQNNSITQMSSPSQKRRKRIYRADSESQVTQDSTRADREDPPSSRKTRKKPERRRSPSSSDSEPRRRQSQRNKGPKTISRRKRV
eukprot:GHVP01039969.1.p1 GENE.GHVP01039969.1~~GHVP01039969.1.p1  ORF type:complete len:280 (+),score=60.66 GHVP01039969.1:77-916(+)